MDSNVVWIDSWNGLNNGMNCKMEWLSRKLNGMEVEIDNAMTGRSMVHIGMDSRLFSRQQDPTIDLNHIF